VFLWLATEPTKIPADTLSILSDPHIQLLLSLASVWEIGIKASTGKLVLGDPIEDLVQHEIDVNGLVLLQIELKHVAAMINLPFHHRDPHLYRGGYQQGNAPRNRDNR